MCAYCESKIKKYHIDHFKTRNQYPEFTFNYNNLFVSCECEKSCAKNKDKIGLNRSDFDNFYFPLSININEFEYTLLGDILGKTDKAKKTIEIFNLNSKSLIHY